MHRVSYIRMRPATTPRSTKGYTFGNRSTNGRFVPSPTTFPEITRMIPARGPQTKEYTELMSCQCNAEQVQAKQSTHCPQVLCAKHLRTMSVLLGYVLLCFAFSVLPTSKAKRRGRRQFLRGYPRLGTLGHPGVPRGTPEHPRVSRGIPGYPRASWGTPGYPRGSLTLLGPKAQAVRRRSSVPSLTRWVI